MTCTDTIKQPVQGRVQWATLSRTISVIKIVMITCIVNYKLLDRAAKARHLTVERLLEVAVFFSSSTVAVVFVVVIAAVANRCRVSFTRDLIVFYLKRTNF